MVCTLPFLRPRRLFSHYFVITQMLFSSFSLSVPNYPLSIFPQQARTLQAFRSCLLADSGIHIIDITQSWTTSNVITTTISTQDDNLKVRRPSIFHDPLDKSINIYGGWPYAQAVTPYLTSWPEGSGTDVKALARIGLNSGKGFPYTRKAGMCPYCPRMKSP